MREAHSRHTSSPRKNHFQIGSTAMAQAQRDVREIGGADLGALADKTIVLCGFMGVGKSSVGRKLARRLQRPFYDLDDLVTARLGRTIQELFASGSEPLFRETEATVLEELVIDAPVSIIALGGGAYADAHSRAFLRSHAFVVHLDQRWEDLYPALNVLRADRPLLAERSNDEIESLYRRRRATYLLADLTVPMPRAGVAIATKTVLHALLAYADAIASS